jgi:hypothetical protein
VNLIPVSAGGAGHVIGSAAYRAENVGDFRLTSSSSAIDAGLNLNTADFSFVQTDLDGTARPQGAAYDIGAYEFRP